MTTPRDHRDDYDPPEGEPVDLGKEDYLNAAFNNGAVITPCRRGADDECRCEPT